MKKIISIILIFVIISGIMCGCSKKNDIQVYKKGEKSEDQITTTTSIKTINVDPFENLKVTFDGVSPFCTISINDSLCDEYVQNNIEWSTLKDTITLDEKFAINDTVTLYANIKNNGVSYSDSGEEIKYTLSTNNKNFTVNNVPGYLMTVDNSIDLTSLKKEVEDYVDSLLASKDSIGIGKAVLSYSDLSFHECWFSSIKKNAYSRFENELKCANYINIIYSVKVKYNDSFWSEISVDEKTTTRYFSVIVKNVVQFTDGQIGWGENDPENLDLTFDNDESKQKILDKVVYSMKTDYNVSNITDLYK